MNIHLIAVGTKMPAWIEQGYTEYSKRMNQDCKLILHEVPASKRGKNADIERILETEGKELLKLIPNNAHIVILDVKGKPYSTEQLGERIKTWMFNGQDVVLLVGGPEGLSLSCRERAKESWSLSNLTFPHPLVRVLVAESIYRAWSFIKGHPYHRADT